MKGDFIGFSFDGIHCSQLGITHVTSSDRYEEDLFPEVKDKTIEIPNNHGEYYYGSTYGTRTFEIEFAYDHITEKQFRDIRRLFGTHKICELIFDERPYKVYYAKIESPINMSYVCFDETKRIEDTQRDGIRRNREEDEYSDNAFSDTISIPAESTVNYVLEHTPKENTLSVEGEVTYSLEENTLVLTNEAEEDVEVTISYTYETITLAWEQVTPWKYLDVKERIYKGEGTINLICYQPFAHQLFKIKELYQEVGSGKGNLITKYDNVDEWIESSGILTRDEWNTYHIDQVLNAVEPYTCAIPLYNPGDLDVGFCLYIPFVNGQILTKEGKSDIIINGDNEILVLKPIDKKGQDTGIIINTRNHLIEGVIFSGIANENDYRIPAWQTTGNLYNEYIKIGEFPQVKRNDWKLDSINNRAQTLYISCAEANKNMSIYYDYLYF